jgi:hypothetical protein
MLGGHMNTVPAPGGGGGDCILGEGVRLESRSGKNFKISNEHRYRATCNVSQLLKGRLYRRKGNTMSNAGEKIVNASKAAPIQGV